MKYKAFRHDASEIHNLKNGSEVILVFDNSDVYAGIFNGLDGDQIMLRAFNTQNIIGLPIARLNCFLEKPQGNFKL